MGWSKNKLRNYYHRIEKASAVLLSQRERKIILPGGFHFVLKAFDEIAEQIQRATYEPEVINVLRMLLKPGQTVLDIGAHAGYFTLMMAAMVGPSGQVHSFEPSPHTFRLLKKNVKRNKLSNVVVNKRAVSNNSGERVFHTYYNDRAAYATFGKPPHPGSMQITVKTLTLDEYVAESNIPKIDLMKIDVEGAEPLVVDGGRGLFGREDAPMLIFE